MHQKRRSGSNNNHRRNSNGRSKYRSGGSGGGGNDSQSLARQKKHAMTQKEKYQNMARDAQSSGERVDAEFYFQHVEHYARMIAEIEAKEPKPEKREAANDDGMSEEVQDEADGNMANGNLADAASLQEEEEDDEPVEAKAAPKPRRRAPSERKPRAKPSANANSDADEIPLPGSVIPEAVAN